jgi:4,5-DOPA dioxygenase extradiol
MTYPTPDAGALAGRVAAAMPDSEPVHRHASRGLDHGAWVPLKVMYPDGDVPVLQLSMPTHDPARLLDIGRRLRALREEGVLVIGSGFMTHGLPILTRDMVIENKVPTWSADFDQWAADALARGDVDTLASFRGKAPGVGYAHPTVEHDTPPVRHPRRRLRPRAARPDHHRRLLHRPVQAVLPDRLAKERNL